MQTGLVHMANDDYVDDDDDDRDYNVELLYILFPFMTTLFMKNVQSLVHSMT